MASPVTAIDPRREQIFHHIVTSLRIPAALRDQLRPLERDVYARHAAVDPSLVSYQEELIVHCHRHLEQWAAAAQVNYSIHPHP